MQRRYALTLMVGFIAGCSSGSSDSTPSTPTATETAETEAETASATPASTATQTESTTSTPTATPEASLDTAAAELNDVYASLEPALETLEVSGLDTAQLTSQLESVRTTLSTVDTADSEQEARRQSLSDTRWIFDRLTRVFGRVQDIYAIHPDLYDAYLAIERTDRVESQMETFLQLAREAGSSAGTAVSRYDAMRSFDDALDVQYDEFEAQIFRVSDSVREFTPLGLALQTSIRARVGYAEAVTLYEEGSYVEAENEFADLLSAFTDAFKKLKEVTAVVGPLEPFVEFYRCDAGGARLACVDYRAACREQLDGNPDDAAERVDNAEVHYATCEPVE